MTDPLIRALKNTGALKFGEFELSHGGTSDYYIDKYCFETNPESLDLIAEEFVEMIDDQKLAGVALGAVPLVAAVSLKSGNNYVIVRKAAKDHGTNNLIEGSLEKGEEVIVIEDVTTTGKSALEAVQALRKNDATVNQVFVVVDREEGAKRLLETHDVKLESLLTAEDLLNSKNEDGAPTRK